MTRLRKLVVALVITAGVCVTIAVADTTRVPSLGVTIAQIVAATTSWTGGVQTFSDEVLKVCDDGDNTKCAELELTGVTPANTVPITITNTAAVAGVRFGTGAFSFNPSGTRSHLIVSNEYRIGASVLIGASSNNDPTVASADVCLIRHAPGVWRICDDTSPSVVRGFLGGGTAVASAAALPLPTGRIFHVTGTTTVTSITSTNFESGAVITLIFDGVLTFTDGSNLVLAGDFVTTASDTITLVYDGTSWHETSRSVN